MAAVQLFQQISQEAFRKGCFCIWIEYSIIWKYTFTLSWKKCLWKNAYINVFIISNCMSHLFLATDFAFNSWLEKRSWSYWDWNCTVCIWHWYLMFVKIQVIKHWYFLFEYCSDLMWEKNCSGIIWLMHLVAAEFFYTTAGYQ